VSGQGKDDRSRQYEDEKLGWDDGKKLEKNVLI